MQKKKQIEVSVNVCDVCGKETSRESFRFTESGHNDYWHFCNEHKTLEEVIKVIANEIKVRDKTGEPIAPNLISSMIESYIFLIKN